MARQGIDKPNRISRVRLSPSLQRSTSKSSAWSAFSPFGRREHLTGFGTKALSRSCASPLRARLRQKSGQICSTNTELFRDLHRCRVRAAALKHFKAAEEIEHIS